MIKKVIGGGIIAIDISTGKILLGRRGLDSEHSNSYSPFGGTFMYSDMHQKNTAIREFQEETGCNVPYSLSKHPFDVRDNNMLNFYLYIALFDSAFNVKINDEHIGYGWYELDNLPDNLHPGFQDTLSEKKEELRKIIKAHKKQIQKTINVKNKKNK